MSSAKKIILKNHLGKIASGTAIGLATGISMVLINKYMFTLNPLNSIMGTGIALAVLYRKDVKAGAKRIGRKLSSSFRFSSDQVQELASHAALIEIVTATITTTLTYGCLTNYMHLAGKA